MNKQGSELQVTHKKIEKINDSGSDFPESFECNITTKSGDTYSAKGVSEDQALERVSYMWYLAGMKGMGYHKNLNPFDS